MYLTPTRHLHGHLLNHYSRMEEGWLGIAGIVSGVLSMIYTYMKHSSCHGQCCGKKMDMEIDLTPVVVEKKDSIV